MFRAQPIILILHICLIFQGCAVLEYLNGSSKDEIKKFKMTKDEIWNEMQKLKTENPKLQKQISISRNENQRMRDENEDKIAMMRDQSELLNQQITKLEEENQRLTDENKILATKLTKFQFKYETFSPGSYELEKGMPKLRMKVLSGDGDLNSAKEMAQKLGNMGYKIESIDHASRSNFLQNTVYSTPKFQNEAKRLVLSLAGNTILKPSTWPSVFDLIVVTGKNP